MQGDIDVPIFDSNSQVTTKFQVDGVSGLANHNVNPHCVNGVRVQCQCTVVTSKRRVSSNL